MRIKLFAATLALLGLSACGRSEHVMSVDPAFTPEQRSLLQNAADQWNAITIPSERIVLVDGPCEDVNEHCVSKRSLPGAWGQSSRKRDYVAVEPTLDPALGEPFRIAFLHNALHEFGHIVGVEEHTATGVMSVGNWSTELEGADVIACDEAGSC